MKATSLVSKYYFPIFCLLAVTIYVFQRLQIDLPFFFQNYMNDLLCMPIVLHICQSAVRKLQSNPSIVLSIPLISFVTLGYALYFEWYLPQHTVRYTADWIDVLLYFMGAVFFYVVEWNKRTIKVNSKEMSH